MSPFGERTFTYVFLTLWLRWFLWVAVGEKYLLHLSSVYGVKSLGEVDKNIVVSMFLEYTYKSTESQNLRRRGSISPKAILVRLKHVGPSGCKSYISVVLGYTEVTLLRKGESGSLYPSIYCLGYIRHYSVGAICRRIPWSYILLGVFHQTLLLSYF